MTNMIFLCDLTSVISQLDYHFSMANAVSLTVELANSVTSYSGSSFNLVMCDSASKCFPIQLIPRADGWQRT